MPSSSPPQISSESKNQAASDRLRPAKRRTKKNATQLAPQSPLIKTPSKRLIIDAHDQLDSSGRTGIRPLHLIQVLLLLLAADRIGCASERQQQDTDSNMAPVAPKYGDNSRASNGRRSPLEQSGGAGGSGDEWQARSLSEFLESLPILSIGLKHKATFECELDERKSNGSKLIWLKLTSRPTSGSDATAAGPSANYDTKLLSLDSRLITPDKRLKVGHQPAGRWTLSIDKVELADDRAWFLCQTSGSQPSEQRPAANGLGARFIGGARLNVLVAPRFVDNETSPSSVAASELAPLELRCKTVGEPRAQINWRREDGRPLDGLEQRFRHQADRRPGQVVSLDSSELAFESLGRHHEGAYLCIASNGISSGVSRRIVVSVLGSDAGADARPAGARKSTAAAAARGRNWKTAPAGGRAGDSGAAAAAAATPGENGAARANQHKSRTANSRGANSAAPSPSGATKLERAAASCATGALSRLGFKFKLELGPSLGLALGLGLALRICFQSPVWLPIGAAARPLRDAKWNLAR